MIDWLVNLILQAAGSVSGLFFSRDAANFAVISGMIALLLVVLFVFFLVYCSSRRSRRNDSQPSP